MAKFTVADHEYMAAPLDTFKQLHIVRRLAPILGTLLVVNKQLLKPEDAFAPLVEGLARMSDDDCDFVLHNCLAVCQRQVQGSTTWGPIFNMGAKRMMYDDIKLAQMLEIAYHVLQENLADFMPSPVLTNGEGAPQ
jgi:hypothetical protein